MATIPCDCCGQPAAKLRPSQEWGFCQTCRDSGCGSLDGGDMHRAAGCPLLLAAATAGADVCMCLQCGKPLHTSEPLTFIDNQNPGRGGCHARCVDAYHASRK